MHARIIRLASDTDYGGILSVLSSSTEVLTPNDKAWFGSLPIKEAIEERRVYMLAERTGVKAFAIVGFDVRDSLFPLSHSNAKAADIAEAMDYPEETMVLEGLFVAGERRGQGLGTELWLSLCSRFKDASWVLALNPENKAKEFFFAQNFQRLAGTNELPGQTLILYKRYRHSGLCREAKW